MKNTYFNAATPRRSSILESSAKTGWTIRYAVEGNRPEAMRWLLAATE
jgi:hypothetical protein